MSEREWQLYEVDAAVRARSPEAATAIEWFWRNGDHTQRYTEFIERARSWCEQPEVRAIFERLRPARPVRQDERFPNLMDWLALSAALGAHDEILEWFDERVAAKDLPLPQMHRLRWAILKRGQLTDSLAFSEPLKAAIETLESVAWANEEMSFDAGLLAHELEEIDCEVALWRRVAEVERPDQLEQIDAAIDASERRECIRAWLARPARELADTLMNHALW
jgi:hypothetical protein